MVPGVRAASILSIVSVACDVYQYQCSLTEPGASQIYIKC